MPKSCHNLHHLNRITIKYPEKVGVGTLNKFNTYVIWITEIYTKFNT